jgi:hypothetical protein
MTNTIKIRLYQTVFTFFLLSALLAFGQQSLSTQYNQEIRSLHRRMDVIQQQSDYMFDLLAR